MVKKPSTAGMLLFGCVTRKVEHVSVGIGSRSTAAKSLQECCEFIRCTAIKPAMANRQPLTLKDVQEFSERLRLTVEKAERFEAMERLFKGTMPHIPQAVVRSVAAPAARPTGATRKGRGRRGKNEALEAQIIDAVKAVDGGLGSPEIAKKLGVSKDRIKPLAQKLKQKGTFKVVGMKRQAKYQFVG
jgi:hypothetical protein